ncbi:MAG: hypothetical protein V1889_02235 [archaeon]
METTLLSIIYYLLSLSLAIPLGIILAKTTKDEKQIYKKYFPKILIILAILTITSLIPPTSYHLPPTIYFLFLFITTLVWHKT